MHVLVVDGANAGAQQRLVAVASGGVDAFVQPFALTQLVEAAVVDMPDAEVRRAGEEPACWVADAVVIDFDRAPRRFRAPADTPAADVHFGTGAAPLFPVSDERCVISLTPDMGWERAVELLARWLWRLRDVLLLPVDRERIALVLDGARGALADGATTRLVLQQIAQVRAALTTLEAQLAAPWPALSVVRWALGEIGRHRSRLLGPDAQEALTAAERGLGSWYVLALPPAW